MFFSLSSQFTINTNSIELLPCRCLKKIFFATKDKKDFVICIFGKINSSLFVVLSIFNPDAADNIQGKLCFYRPS